MICRRWGRIKWRVRMILRIGERTRHPSPVVRQAHHPSNSFDFAHDPSNDPEPVEGHPERSRGITSHQDRKSPESNFNFSYGLQNFFLTGDGYSRALVTSRELRNLTGFTLLELMLVLVILGVIAGLVVPNFSRTYSGLLLKKSVEDLSYLMRYAQSRAVIQSKTVRLCCDAVENRYWLEDNAAEEAAAGDTMSFQKIAGRFGRIYSLPADVQLTCPADHVHFFPNGAMDKARLAISHQENSWTISTAEQKNHVLAYPTASAADFPSRKFSAVESEEK